MNDKNARLGRLSAWVQQEDERRERERELPKAHCRVCGGWAKAGEGTRDGVQKGLKPHPFRPGLMVAPAPVPAPANADDWRRECAKCATANVSEIVSAVVRSEVSDADARTVVSRMKTIDPDDLTIKIAFPTAQSIGSASGRPWGHLRDEDRVKVRRVLREVIIDRLPGISAWGACGMCGRRHSVRWHEGPSCLKWPDGSRAPVCSECQQVLLRRPEPSTIEQLRVYAVEAATGFAQWGYRAADEFRVYVETKDCDGNGYAEPWDYAAGIVAFREEMWTAMPRLAPEERRHEFRQRLHNRMAENEREERERQQNADALAW